MVKVYLALEVNRIIIFCFITRSKFVPNGIRDKKGFKR